jgi:hypothetical protein
LEVAGNANQLAAAVPRAVLGSSTSVVASDAKLVL